MADLNFSLNGRHFKLIRRGKKLYFRIQLNGKNVCRPCGHVTAIPAAKTNAKNDLAKLLAGPLPVERKATFYSILENFVATRKSHAERTQRNDQWILRVIRDTCPETQRELDGKMGLALNTPATEVLAGDILAWMTELAQANNYRPKTVNHFHAFLQQAFDLAVANRFLTRDENPFSTKLVKRRKVGKPLRFVPTEEQFKIILDHVRERWGDDCADFFEFEAMAGLGHAEVKHLRARDVQFAKGGKGEDTLQVLRIKTGKHFPIPIYRWLKPVVERRLMRAFNNPDQPLFNDDMRDNVLSQHLRRACKSLGFKYRDEHTGRMRARFSQRSFRCMTIKRLNDAGVFYKRIAEWQGHQDGGKLLLTTYTEVFSDSDAAARAADLAKVA
jgi:integrase